MHNRCWLAVIICITLASTSTIYPLTQVLFSPKDSPTTTLLELIGNAKKSIIAAVYMLTDQKIASALVGAAERGVAISLVIDRCSTDQYGKADYLAQSGIAVAVFKSIKVPKWGFGGLMHNKFAVFDSKKLWTGSFNWTQSANKMNCENVIISDDPIVCAVYTAYFQALASTNTVPYISRPYKESSVSLTQQVQSLLTTCTNDEALHEALVALLT